MLSVWFFSSGDTGYISSIRAPPTYIGNCGPGALVITRLNMRCEKLLAARTLIACSSPARTPTAVPGSRAVTRGCWLALRLGGMRDVREPDHGVRFPHRQVDEERRSPSTRATRTSSRYTDIGTTARSVVDSVIGSPRDSSQLRSAPDDDGEDDVVDRATRLRADPAVVPEVGADHRESAVAGDGCVERTGGRRVLSADPSIRDHSAERLHRRLRSPGSLRRSGGATPRHPRPGGSPCGRGRRPTSADARGLVVGIHSSAATAARLRRVEDHVTDLERVGHRRPARLRSW